MSTAMFPTLPGLAWPVQRRPIWATRTQNAVSGKRINLADWSTPKYRWGLTYNFLRGAPNYSEMETLAGFFNARYGSFDSFLYTDPNDYSATGSTLGTGDSTDRTFQLQRRYGSTYDGLVEPIYAPLAVSRMAVGASTYSSTQFSVLSWGTTSPGLVTFSTFAPSTGLAVTADFTYAWPVSFDADSLDFDEFVRRIWELKTITFTSLK